MEREGGEGERFVYYAYPATGLGGLGLGALYWVYWAKIRRKRRVMVGFGNGLEGTSVCVGKDEGREGMLDWPG